MTFQLSCVACSFETVVDEDVDAVFDVIEEHQTEHVAGSTSHFVDFERVEHAGSD